jgi:hypothetical protein
MKFTERAEFYANLTDHTLMSDSTRVMQLMEKIVHDETINVFDRGTFVRQLTESWQAAREDVVIPPNPNDAPYVLVRIGNPAMHVFVASKEQGLQMRFANARAGLATRLIDCKTAEVIVGDE